MQKLYIMYNYFGRYLFSEERTCNETSNMMAHVLNIQSLLEILKCAHTDLHLNQIIVDKISLTPKIIDLKALTCEQDGYDTAKNRPKIPYDGLKYWFKDFANLSAKFRDSKETQECATEIERMIEMIDM